jgi:hypothetical protein
MGLVTANYEGNFPCAEAAGLFEPGANVVHPPPLGTTFV